MEFFAGIDLGKRRSQIQVLNQDRKVVEELKIDNDPKEFFRIFKRVSLRSFSGRTSSRRSPSLLSVFESFAS